MQIYTASTLIVGAETNRVNSMGSVYQSPKPFKEEGRLKALGSDADRETSVDEPRNDQFETEMRQPPTT